MNWKTISADIFAEQFQCQPSDLGENALATLQNLDFRWCPSNKKDAEDYLLEFLPKLQGTWIERNRDENHDAWEKGWSESLREVQSQGAGPGTCRPKYFRGSKFLRFKKDIILSPNPQLEHNLLTATREYLFSRYLKHSSTICELGCGSGQNLWLLSEMFPQKNILGMDWVRPCVEIAYEIARTGKNVEGRLFDMTNPSKDDQIPPDSAIVTIHAMEQIGKDHHKLIEWILSQRPAIVVQHEPILEFYDETNLYDYMALWYSRKRNYLDGYLTALKELEKQNKVEFLSCFRPEIGGVYHEGSVLVWKPINQ
jgi:hypothetical protein